MEKKLKKKNLGVIITQTFQDTSPTTNWWYAEWKLSRNMYTLRTRFFCTFGADLHAQSVLSNKNSASESSGESLLRVRCWLGLVPLSFFLVLTGAHKKK